MSSIASRITRIARSWASESQASGSRTTAALSKRMSWTGSSRAIATHLNSNPKYPIPPLRPITRTFATPPVQEATSTISSAEFHAFADDTMETLEESLETLIDEASDAAYEVEYSSGVLTLKLGNNGTYVINKQPPNKQIWLSSPSSGPKRYDYDSDGGKWVYARDGQSLGVLLDQELSRIFDKEIHLGIEPEDPPPSSS